MPDDTEKENRRILDAIETLHAEGALGDDVKRAAAAAGEEPDREARASRVDQLVLEVRTHAADRFDQLLPDVVRGWSAGDSRLAGDDPDPSARIAIECRTCGYTNHLPYVPTDDDPVACQNPNPPLHPLKVR